MVTRYSTAGPSGSTRLSISGSHATLDDRSVILHEPCVRQRPEYAHLSCDKRLVLPDGRKLVAAALPLFSRDTTVPTAPPREILPVQAPLGARRSLVARRCAGGRFARQGARRLRALLR